MTGMETAYLVLTLLGFAAFAVVLAWETHRTA